MFNSKMREKKEKEMLNESFKQTPNSSRIVERDELD